MVPLLTRRYAGMSVEDAYAVQNEWRRRAIAAGRRPVGRKIGLTSKVMQAATGIDEPDYGAIFADMVLENGSVIEHGRFSNVRIEVELAFALAEPVDGPDASVLDVLRATEYVVPALEILSSRVEPRGPHHRRHDQRQRRDGRDGLRRQPGPAGRRRPALGRGPAVPQRDDRGVRRRGRRAQPPRDGRGVAGQQGSPSTATASRPGSLVLAGSFTRPMWVRPGDTVLADFRDLGTISCRFV